MKLLPLIIISLTTVVFNYSLPVSGKPTENQDSGVEPLQTSHLRPAATTVWQIIKSNQLNDFAKLNEKKLLQPPIKLVHQPAQQKSIYGYVSQAQWPQIQSLFFQQPQFSTSQQFLLSHTNLIYPGAAFPSAPFPPTPFPLRSLVIPIPTATPATERPLKKKDREPTTAPPPLATKFDTKPSLLKANTQTIQSNDLRSDHNLLAGVRKINPIFVIEEFVSVPGTNVFSNTILDKSYSEESRVSAKRPTKGNIIKNVVQATTQKRDKPMLGSHKVKVEATGSSATSGNIPEIPFGTYFLPYLSQATAGGKIAALILEPHSKAVVGNGGTAISKPISRAILKKGVPTNVFFNPESVAIAGVGGKAHAEAELELDLISRR